MKLLIFAFLLLPYWAFSEENPFTQSLQELRAHPNTTPWQLVALVGDPAYSSYLSPDQKTGMKMLRLVLNDLLVYSRQEWVRQQDMDDLLGSFAAGGFDFTRKEKNNSSYTLLQEFVYDQEYLYQNVGLMLFDGLLRLGVDPFYTATKNQPSAFTFSLDRLVSETSYFDLIINHVDFNHYQSALADSPFLWLAGHGHPHYLTAIRQLVDYDSTLNINYRAEGGKTTVFDRAIALDDTALARLLITANMDLLAICDICAGENYLHRIALYDARYILGILPKELVASLINAPDVNGRTPIFWALGAGYCQMAIALLKAGADLNYQTPDGETVMDVAYKNSKANREFVALVGNMGEH